jgi:hypothetical protein
MNKKILIATAVVFVFFAIYSVVLNGFILGSAYQELASLWRPDMQRLVWVYQVLNLVGAFFFVFVFSKGYEGKGMMEGIRYGLYIGIWMGMGYAYGTYAMIAIPYWMAATWFWTTILQYIIAGMITAAMFGKVPMVTAITPSGKP